jgi:membrane-associated phospholipid phosphatase
MLSAPNTTTAAHSRWWVFWSNYSFAIFLPAGLYVLTLPSRAAAILLAGAAFVVARFVLTPLIARIYPKPRPYQVSGQVPTTSWFFSWATTKANSFPSRHVISLTTFSVIVFHIAPWLGVALLGVTVMTGWARVRLGFHDWWDILGGLILGALVAELVILLSKNLISSIL